MVRKPVALIIAVIAAGIVCSAAFAGFAIWRASKALHLAKSDVGSERKIQFTVRPFISAGDSAYEQVSSPAVFIHAAMFEGKLYIAGPAGLCAYDSSGMLIEKYAVGSALPGSPLVGLTTAVLADSQESELILATADDGLLVFNGHAFRQIFPEDADARAVTAILPTPSGHLLIGTKKRGVLVYDGKQITPLHLALSDHYVTALAGDDSDLWVGTLNQGVLHFSAGTTQIFNENTGLPDQQVTSLTIFNQTAYVGTPLGVAVFRDGRFSHVLAPGILATALLASASNLYVGSEDQGVLAIPLESQRSRGGSNPNSEIIEVRQLFRAGESVFALSRSGLYELKPHASGWRKVIQPETAVLADRNISALASDSKGQLWIGYFDRGLDILTEDRTHARHIEDEHVFCINRIFPNSKSGGMDIATANGLVRFNAAGNEQQILTHADGLIADDVTDIADYGDGAVLATPAGLTFLDPSGARSMYAFQGLVNNHVYALGISGDELLIGTLGGISILEKGIVTVNYTTANSGLKHNWITAVVRVGSGWMIGTYGAGVLEMDHNGQFRRFDIGSGNFEVNPNAMLVTQNFVLAGTLGKGLYIYNRTSGHWSVVESGLPSLNVTALTAANGYLYIGTDNGLVRVPEEALHP